MKNFIIKFLKNFWGVIPIIFVAPYGIFITVYLQLNTNVMLRSVPAQLLYWGIVLAVLLLLIWGLWLLFKVAQRYKSKIFFAFFVILSVVLFVGSIVALYMAAFVSAFTYNPEHVVERYGIKMVASVNSFLDINVEYYEYKNFMFHGTKKLGHEWYGSGGYDPFENGEPKFKPRSWSFYDLNGNLLDSGERDSSQQ